MAKIKGFIMKNLFQDDVPDKFLEEVFCSMEEYDWHTYIVLTKTPGRMVEFINWYIKRRSDDSVGLKYHIPPHIWLGVTAENQQTADERIPILLQIPTVVHFVSVEPMLGPIKFRPYTLTERPCFVCKSEDSLKEERGAQSHPINCGWRKTQNTSRGGIDWVIAGGETGPNARPCHPDWVRSLRDQCQAAGVPFFFKSWGDWVPSNQYPSELNGVRLSRYKKYTFEDDYQHMFRVGKKKAGRLLDGREWNEYPNLNIGG